LQVVILSNLGDNTKLQRSGCNRHIGFRRFYLPIQLSSTCTRRLRKFKKLHLTLTLLQQQPSSSNPEAHRPPAKPSGDTRHHQQASSLRYRSSARHRPGRSLRSIRILSKSHSPTKPTLWQVTGFTTATSQTIRELLTPVETIASSSARTRSCLSL
jgi:hypothetical protein